MTTVIRVDQLTKQYGDLTAVKQISFDVIEGHCFGLLGPNGAGKTTTIEMMEGIIPSTSGEIFYHNKRMSENIAQHIGIQFQHTALQDYLTVKETLSLFSSFYDKTMPIDELIEVCDLQDFLNRDNRLLSGGQRQRLLLALALINDPDIIYLDEPTTGLDPQARRNFWALIQKIKQRNKTIILTTHYMDEAEQLCDQLIVMDHGDIIEQGSPNELLSKHFAEVFVYLPKTQIPEQLIQQNHWSVQGERVEISTANIEQTLSLLMSENISLHGLQVKSATLDDLFLKLTGHSIRE